METKARYLLIGSFTLIVVAAMFGFVYWLHAYGGLGQRSLYQVRFEGPVPGLLAGSPVLFNGIRVGEVTGLELGRDDPKRVTATIAIDPAAPVRADTQVGLEAQGLLGASAAITLTGGAATSPAVAGAPPLLLADASAGQGMTQVARDALRRLDQLVADNSASLHATIENLKVFSDALARNSDRVDGIIAGIERLSGAPPKPPSGYDLTAPAGFPPPAKPPSGQLAVPDPTAVLMFDTQKILIRSPSGEMTTVANAQWSDTVPKLVQAKIIQTFENAHDLAEVTRPIEGLTASAQLLIDIRSFEIVLSPDPVADVEFSAKILGDGGKIVAARIFNASVPAKDVEAPAAPAAINQAFGKVAADLVTWASGKI
ncbi:MAG TPA: ABC-type transport auxiliary lipoprotein family protein [Xanthobacteraceae bacterium]|nr:ABC-type transport auxiliary lipoprotein family protein [Xanthobacteraceae bacterium]